MTRAPLVAVCIALVLGAVIFARPHPTPGPPMRDFEAYYAAGATANAGGDPYSLALWDRERAVAPDAQGRFTFLPFVSPPAALVLFRAIALLPFDFANVLWRGILVLSIGALVYLSARFSKRRAFAVVLLALACAALGFGPLTSALALGQLALPAYAFACAALAFPPFALLAWVQPNIVPILLSQIGSLRVMIFAAAGALAVALAGLPYFSMLRAHGEAERLSAIQLTPAAIAFGFGAPPRLAQDLGTAIAIVAVLLWLAAMRAVRTPVERLCVTCSLLPLAMPFFHEHDAVVAFIPAVFWSVRSSPRLWPMAAAGALLCAIDWLGLAQRPDGAVQTVLLGCAFSLALYVVRGSALQRRAALSTIVILAAIPMLAMVAAHYPMPVWPDAMRAIAPAQLTGSATAWHAEQAATGLFHRSALWAALRCLTLLGCVLLSAVPLLELRYRRCAYHRTA